MGVKKQEDVLCRAAWMFVNNKLKKELFLRAALMYGKAKQKARNSRDEWKIRKRLEQ